MKEIWKDIPGYEGYYQASSCGRIKSIQRLVNTHNQFRKSLMNIRERILKPATNRHGYSIVVLYINNTQKTISVHRLVARTFIPNPLGKIQVNHIDGIKSNNHVENLEWNTNSENVKHSFSTNIRPPTYGNSKLTEEQVREIRRLYEIMGWKQSDIARKFNVYKTLIHKIVHNETWKHLSINY